MAKYVNEANLQRFWNNIQDQIGNASQEQVNAWLNAHPEATTTVQDGSITTEKLADGAVTDAKLVQTGGVLDDVASLAGIMDSGAAPASFSFEDGYINPGTGQSMALSGFVRTVGYIKLVGKLLSVTVPEGFEIIVFNYDDSKGFIDYYSWWSGTVTKYDMGDIGFVRIAARSTTSTPITVSDMDNLVITMESREILSLQGQINETNASVDEFGITHVNLFDKSTRTDGYVVGGNGSLSPNASFFASDFIDVSSYESVVLSWTHITHFYTADKSNIALSDTYPSLDSDVRVQVPQGAKYLRFSTYNENLSKAQVGPHVSRANYVPYSHYYLPDLRQSNNAIIVDAAGNGDYTSFTKAVYDNLDTGVPIVVRAGTYDIEAEYVALFGQSVVDSLSDATAGINGFQYGIVLRNRRIEFECGSRLVCDWTGHTIDSTHRFSALMVGYDVEIVGLDIDCTKTWYVIHDDQAPSDNSPFTTAYRNCRVIGHSIVNANCIGGGCHKFSRHVLENCYFDNGIHTYGNPDVRYHNTAVSGAKPEVFVSNCYFATGLTLSYYGTQTEKMRAYVNNCYAQHGINKVPETSGSTVDNVDIYKWNNVENA